MNRERIEMRNAERIDQIRSKVHTERKLLAEIGQKIADEEVKKVLLGPASLRLDQVERFYLGEERLAETRSEANLAKWLDGAERELRSAMTRRAEAEATVQKFAAGSLK
jgi:hypothetical protein